MAVVISLSVNWCDCGFDCDLRFKESQIASAKGVGAVSLSHLEGLQIRGQRWGIGSIIVGSARTPAQIQP